VKASRLNRWITLLIPLGALLGPVTNVLAEAIGLAPDSFVLDGATREWQAQPANLTLKPKSAGARTGKVWLAQAPQGLVIAGAVGGPVPTFAQNPKDMPQGDHVEMWIALADDIPLPPIGWYNKFGTTGLDDEDSRLSSNPSEKVAWLAKQQQYRRQLLRLFMRQWQLAPSVAVETYAQPAFAALPEGDKLQTLSPRGQPLTGFATTPAGYTFEILIPWEILPPSNRLKLTELWVLVDVFSPGDTGRYGPFSTTSPARAYGKVKTLNRIALNPPRRWRLPCDLPLEGYNIWGQLALSGYSQFAPGGFVEAESLPSKPERLPAYFLPAAGTDIRDIFVIDNELTDLHAVPDWSPTIRTTSLFNLELGPDVSACGPELAVRRGETLTRSRLLGIEPDTRFKPVPGGWLLAVGPSTVMASPTAEGYCGACEETRMEMLFVPAAHAPPKSAFGDSWPAECECCAPNHGGCNPKIELAEDFQSLKVTVTAEDETGGGTTQTLIHYCFKTATHTFVECERQTVETSPMDEAPPPNLH
jgi:hypothetical protein